MTGATLAVAPFLWTMMVSHPTWRLPSMDRALSIG